MRKIVLLALIAIASMGTADAQRRGRQNFNPEQRVEKQMEILNKKLKLSDEQEQKIKTLYGDFFNQKISREQRKTKKAELDKKVESLLTEEQKKVFSEMNNKSQQGKRQK